MKFPKPQTTPSVKREKVRAKEQQWQKVRRQVLERDGHRCRVCNIREGGIVRVDVHHIRFRSVGGSVSDTSNLAALCRICHGEVHAYRLVISGDANRKLEIERSA